MMNEVIHAMEPEQAVLYFTAQYLIYRMAAMSDGCTVGFGEDCDVNEGSLFDHFCEIQRLRFGASTFRHAVNGARIAIDRMHGVGR